MRLLNDFLPDDEQVHPWEFKGRIHPALPDDAEYSIFEHFPQTTDLNCKMAVIEIFRPHEAYELGHVILEASVVIDYDWSSNATNPQPVLAPESPKDELALNLFEAFKIVLEDDEYQKRLNEHCLRLKKILSQPKRQSINKSVKNAARHIGRNDPCPCGSGKKYKKCCLQK
ncbi:MAG: SEC-C metal-binding domain-containing protein [Marinomonas sp.]